MTTAFDDIRRSRSFSPLVVASLGVRVGQRARRRAARHAAAGQVPLRQGQRVAGPEEVADRARVLQAGHRNLHAEPGPARTPSSAIGDTYLGEGIGGSAGPGDQRVPGVPLVLSDQPARRLRAVQARARALPADAVAAARPDRDARRDPRVRDVRRALPEQRADARGEATGCARRAIGSARRTTWSAASTTGIPGIRARSIGSRRC